MAILTEDPVPIAGLDADLSEIILRGLQKQRDDRWNDAREMGEELATWMVGNGVYEDVTGRSLKAWLGVTPRQIKSPNSTTKPNHTLVRAARERSARLPWIVGSVALAGAVAAAAVAAFAVSNEPPEGRPVLADVTPQKTAPPPTAAEVESTEEPSAPTVLPVAASSAPPQPSASAPPRATVVRPRARPVPPPKPPSPPPKPSDGKLPIPAEVPF